MQNTRQNYILREYTTACTFKYVNYKFDAKLSQNTINRYVNTDKIAFVGSHFVVVHAFIVRSRKGVGLQRACKRATMYR